MKKYLLLGLGWLWALASWSQTEEVILTYDEYLQMVLEDHPVAKQAQLKMDLAEAQWLSAKGGFDPMIESNFDQKHFDQKRYYRHFQSRLSVPTRLGIDLVAGYENTEGIFLNPEKTTDPKGLWNLGVEVNVLQGLLVNERRMALQQAQIFRQMSENQQASMLNDLLFGASMVYLDWQKYFSFQGILNENLALAQVYFESTKLSFENGEKTAIDTLEAMIMMQDATNLIQSNDALLTKAKQNLDNFLWQDDLPRTLTVPLIPQTYTQALSTFSDSSAVVDWINTHPEILEKMNKQDLLQVEQRLKREKLKPKLKIKFNPLIATSETSLVPDYALSDQKWGVNFSMPILMRKERADIQKVEIKMAENQLDINNKRNELQNKIENSLRQQDILQAQLALQEQSVEGYRRLLEGENEKFRFGESSVFLVNKRQEKYINGRLKRIDLFIKIQMEKLAYRYYINRIDVQ